MFVLRSLVTAKVFSSSLILFILMMNAIYVLRNVGPYKSQEA
jgi:hypothetical protein